MVTTAKPRVEAQALIQFWRNDRDGTYAADILKLGMDVYGHKPDEAEQKVRRMFAGAIAVHWLRGALQEWLDKNGLEWRWQDYPEQGIAVVVPDPSTDDKPTGWSLVGRERRRLIVP